MKSFQPEGVRPASVLPMASYQSSATAIKLDQYEPEGGGKHPALLMLHGSGGAASYWLSQFAPRLTQAGVGLYAPHYFDKTATQRATAEMILDGRHFVSWLAAVRDAITYVADRPYVCSERIGILGISLGGYLAVAAGIEDKRVKAVVEVSGGVPPGWENRVTSQMPPTLILHGGEDRVVPVAEAHKLQTVLEQQKAIHDVEIYPRETHWFSSGAQMGLMMHCADFLGTHLFGLGPAGDVERAGECG